MLAINKHTLCQVLLFFLFVAFVCVGRGSVVLCGLVGVGLLLNFTYYLFHFKFIFNLIFFICVASWRYYNNEIQMEQLTERQSDSGAADH